MADNDNRDHFDPSDANGLPTTLFIWRKLRTEDAFWAPWEYLRSFFLDCGYDLFRDNTKLRGNTYPQTPHPAADSFGLNGDRTRFKSHFFIVSAIAYAARDRMGRDVIIKVISKGEEGVQELQILKLLNSAPLRLDPANATVPVLEFLAYGDWTFAVMPRWGSCTFPPLKDAAECLEFADQVVSGLSFLHQNLIAHLDVISDNIVLSCYGTLPTLFDSAGRPIFVIPEFRSTFPVKYAFIDFAPFLITREQRPMEMDGRFHYDPFAADVYQAARYLYAQLHTIVPAISGLLLLFQDM